MTSEKNSDTLIIQAFVKQTTPPRIQPVWTVSENGPEFAPTIIRWQVMNFMTCVDMNFFNADRRTREP
jgi:hypothetical protein